MKTTKLNHWKINKLHLEPINEIFPDECRTSIMRLHFVKPTKGRFEVLQNVSETVVATAEHLRRGTEQLPAFIELVTEVKHRDSRQQIDWINTCKVVEFILEKKYYRPIFISAVLGMIYSAVGMLEPVATSESNGK